MLKYLFKENKGGGDDKADENSMDVDDGEHNHSLSKEKHCIVNIIYILNHNYCV